MISCADCLEEFGPVWLYARAVVPVVVVGGRSLCLRHLTAPYRPVVVVQP